MTPGDSNARRRIPSRPFPKQPEPPGSKVPPSSASDSSQDNKEEEAWTIGRLLTWTTDYLKKKGAESPRLDAEVLLSHALGCQRVTLYTQYETKVEAEPRGRFRELVRQRVEGKPVAYLVGRKEFFSMAFEVGPAVLIPRPDTETLVVEFLNQFKSRADVVVVDVGTGSGAIALACLKHHESARFLATDVSEEALGVARRNAEKLGLADRVRFLKADLLEGIMDEGPFDAVLSNPPYIATDEIAGLEPGVRDYEPHLALDGGADGLRVVARLVEQAVGRLKPGGQLLLEIGSAQEGPVRGLIEGYAEMTLVPTIRDAANHPRVIRAVRAGEG